MVKYMFLIYFFYFKFLQMSNLYYLDTLAKLVEYGDDDDDSDEPPVTKWRQQSVPKPFWAV